MEAIKAQVKFVEYNAEVDVNPVGDFISELDELQLALVGGGSGAVVF